MGQDESSTRQLRVWQDAGARDFGILVFLALAIILLHTLTNGQYGFHRDELLTFSNARHLEWGYVVYPPMTPFLGRVELELFGTSLRGFRFFAAVSQGLVLLLTGLAARELGGKREAQLVAALATAIAGPALVAGWFLGYTSFDYLWWVVVAYFVIRLLKSDDPRWWVAIGAAIGLGMMTKYAMAFSGVGSCGRRASDAGPAIPEEPMVVVRGGRSLANHAAQYRLADPSSFCFTRVAEECSRTRHWLGLDGLLSAESALEMHQHRNRAAVVRRALVPVRCAGRQALPHAGLDVCYSALGVIRRQRARLLPRSGLPHASRGRSRLGRAVGEFTEHSLRFDSPASHLANLGGSRAYCPPQ